MNTVELRHQLKGQKGLVATITAIEKLTLERVEIQSREREIEAIKSANSKSLMEGLKKVGAKQLETAGVGTAAIVTQERKNFKPELLREYMKTVYGFSDQKVDSLVAACTTYTDMEFVKVSPAR